MKKDRIKQHGNKVILYITGSSLLYGACGIPEYNHQIQEYNQSDFFPDSDFGMELLPIDVYLDEDEMELIYLIENFVVNLISDSSFAKRFRENKMAVLKEYHLETIQLDENSSEIQLLFALSEEDILKAIKEGDVKKCSTFLNKKGFFNQKK